MPYLVGVAGGSASGKSSIIHAIRSNFGPKDIAILSQDNYYHPREKQVCDERGTINFDLPEAIDHQGFIRDLEALNSGNSIRRQEYTFNNPSAQASMVEVSPAPVLIIEGLFIFHFAELFTRFNLRVYVEAKEEIKLKRRLERDLRERGYPESDVLYRWKHHVMPAYRSFLLPYRDRSDIIITNNETYQRGLDVLLDHLFAKVRAANCG